MTADGWTLEDFASPLSSLLHLIWDGGPSEQSCGPVIRAVNSCIRYRTVTAADSEL
jgi:hypothetical protein